MGHISLLSSSFKAKYKNLWKIYAKFLFNKLFGVKLSCNWFIGSREEDENVESLQQNANMTEEDKFWPKNSHQPLVQVS